MLSWIESINIKIYLFLLVFLECEIDNNSICKKKKKLFIMYMFIVGLWN